MSERSWICCQLGAREHYAVPRALHSLGKLDLLLTDTWAPPSSIWASLPWRRLQDRFHESLRAARISAFNRQALWFEASRRPWLRGWNLVMARNEWFQDCVLRRLRRYPGAGATVFCYSYSARRIFEYAKERGWRTVLGQIDPGLYEDRLVSQVAASTPESDQSWTPAPPGYWDLWRRECVLADHILVNSGWSRQALLSEGIPASKVTVVPLVYEPPAGAAAFQRSVPAAFDERRPLRALFLGQVTVRKGVTVLFEVMRRLRSAPVEFWMVGPVTVRVPEDVKNLPTVRWGGPVPRSQTSQYYRNADIFLFPTFSDGFGLTQLEAQAWKLPVIASRFCGEVVEHERNGLLLPEVTPEAIEAAVARCLETPALVAAMSAASAIAPRFHPSALTQWFAEFEPAHV